MASVKKGDHVTWKTPQGRTSGTVVEKVTSTTKIAGHTATASKEAPQFKVRSDKTGKQAIHKAEGLSKG